MLTVPIPGLAKGLLVGALAVTSAVTAPAPFAAADPPPPPAGARFEYQIGGMSEPVPGTRVVSRDWHDPPALGLYSICYVNAFQTQPDELRWWKRNNRSLLLRKRGRLVVDGFWGEVLLDTTTSAKRRRLTEIHSQALSSCAARGYEAVEFDNLDSFDRSRGRIRMRHNLDLARRLAAVSHRLGLAVAQKNTVELGRRGRDAAGFDFAIAEECERYRECGQYMSVYGSNVIEVEYVDQGRKWFRRACARRGGRVSVLLRDRDVTPRGRPGHVSEWC